MGDWGRLGVARQAQLGSRLGLTRPPRVSLSTPPVMCLFAGVITEVPVSMHRRAVELAARQDGGVAVRAEVSTAAERVIGL